MTVIPISYPAELITTVHLTMETCKAPQTPSFDMEVDYRYDPVNWLKKAESSEEPRHKLAQTLREQSNLCRQRAKLHNGVDLAVPYGNSFNDGHGTEAFDWFSPFRIPHDTQHVIVYVHGGYWRSLDLPESSHWATPVTDLNGIFVGVAYRLCPWQTIQTMPERLCLALRTVFEHSYKRISQEIKATPNIKMHLVGHSAGAQLIIEAVVHAIKLPSEQQQWLQSVRSFILLSGIYDLRPLLQTSINKALKLESTEQAWEVSPLRLFAESSCAAQIPRSIRWLICWAEFDSPAIVEQSHQLINFMRERLGDQESEGERKSCSCDGRLETFCVSDEDHFSSIEKLHWGAKQSAFFKKTLQFISLDDNDP